MIGETPTFIPVVYLGDVTAQRTYALGVVASGRRGLRVSALRVTTTRDVAPNVNGYWTIQIGVLTLNGNFSTEAQFSLARSGLKAGGFATLSADPPAIFSPGQVIALRAKANGKPVPIENFGVMVDYVPFTTEA